MNEDEIVAALQAVRHMPNMTLSTRYLTSKNTTILSLALRCFFMKKKGKEKAIEQTSASSRNKENKITRTAIEGRTIESRKIKRAYAS